MLSFKKLIALLSVIVMSSLPSAAATQNDAGTGSDAGNTFEAATRLTPRGAYNGTLNALDRNDFYKFALAEGEALSVLITPTTSTMGPFTLLDPNGIVLDTGARVSSLGVTHAGAMTSEGPIVRLALHRAVMAGDYRLHISAERTTPGSYALCFMNCEGVKKAPIEMIFGGSLRSVNTRVLLVPPSHGDLGDPSGPTVVEYIDATLRGIHRWTAAMDEFATDYPEYSYLRKIKVSVEIFDGADPVDPAGYDVVIGYVAAGPAFRGIAGSFYDPQPRIDGRGLGGALRASGRTIALSLFGSSPRAGQVAYDFPELTDLEIVTIHEFAHTFGLGHTTNWDPVLGPDLMNSPAPFIYGNGSAVGAGTERTSMKCLSSLDLYGMAHLYRWVPSGVWQGTGYITKQLPAHIPYKWYC